MRLFTIKVFLFWIVFVFSVAETFSKYQEKKDNLSEGKIHKDIHKSNTHEADNGHNIKIKKPQKVTKEEKIKEENMSKREQPKVRHTQLMHTVKTVNQGKKHKDSHVSNTHEVHNDHNIKTNQKVVKDENKVKAENISKQKHPELGQHTQRHTVKTVNQGKKHKDTYEVHNDHNIKANQKVVKDENKVKAENISKQKHPELGQHTQLKHTVKTVNQGKKHKDTHEVHNDHNIKTNQKVTKDENKVKAENTSKQNQPEARQHTPLMHTVKHSKEPTPILKTHKLVTSLLTTERHNEHNVVTKLKKIDKVKKNNATNESHVRKYHTKLATNPTHKTTKLGKVTLLKNQKEMSTESKEATTITNVKVTQTQNPGLMSTHVKSTSTHNPKPITMQNLKPTSTHNPMEISTRFVKVTSTHNKDIKSTQNIKLTSTHNEMLTRHVKHTSASNKEMMSTQHMKLTSTQSPKMMTTETLRLSSKKQPKEVTSNKIKLSTQIPKVVSKEKTKSTSTRNRKSGSTQIRKLNSTKNPILISTQEPNLRLTPKLKLTSSKLPELMSTSYKGMLTPNKKVMSTQELILTSTQNHKTTRINKEITTKKINLTKKHTKQSIDDNNEVIMTKEVPHPTTSRVIKEQYILTPNVEQRQNDPFLQRPNDQFVQRPNDQFIQRQNDQFPQRQNDPFPQRYNDPLIQRQNNPFPQRQNDPFPQRYNDPLIQRQNDPFPQRQGYNYMVTNEPTHKKHHHRHHHRHHKHHHKHKNHNVNNGVIADNTLNANAQKTRDYNNYDLNANRRIDGINNVNVNPNLQNLEQQPILDANANGNYREQNNFNNRPELGVNQQDQVNHHRKSHHHHRHHRHTQQQTYGENVDRVNDGNVRYNQQGMGYNLPGAPFGQFRMTISPINVLRPINNVNVGMRSKIADPNIKRTAQFKTKMMSVLTTHKPTNHKEKSSESFSLKGLSKTLMDNIYDNTLGMFLKKKPSTTEKYIHTTESCKTHDAHNTISKNHQGIATSTLIAITLRHLLHDEITTLRNSHSSKPHEDVIKDHLSVTNSSHVYTNKKIPLTKILTVTPLISTSTIHTNMLKHTVTLIPNHKFHTTKHINGQEKAINSSIEDESTSRQSKSIDRTTHTIINTHKLQNATWHDSRHINIKILEQHNSVNMTLNKEHVHGKVTTQSNFRADVNHNHVEHTTSLYTNHANKSEHFEKQFNENFVNMKEHHEKTTSVHPVHHVTDVTNKMHHNGERYNNLHQLTTHNYNLHHTFHSTVHSNHFTKHNNDYDFNTQSTINNGFPRDVYEPKPNKYETEKNIIHEHFTTSRYAHVVDTTETTTFSTTDNINHNRNDYDMNDLISTTNMPTYTDSTTVRTTRNDYSGETTPISTTTEDYLSYKRRLRTTSGYNTYGNNGGTTSSYYSRLRRLMSTDETTTHSTTTNYATTTDSTTMKTTESSHTTDSTQKMSTVIPTTEMQLAEKFTENAVVPEYIITKKHRVKHKKRKKSKYRNDISPQSTTEKLFTVKVYEHHSQHNLLTTLVPIEEIPDDNDDIDKAENDCNLQKAWTIIYNSWLQKVIDTVKNVTHYICARLLPSTVWRVIHKKVGTRSNKHVADKDEHHQSNINIDDKLESNELLIESQQERSLPHHEKSIAGNEQEGGSHHENNFRSHRKSISVEHEEQSSLQHNDFIVGSQQKYNSDQKKESFIHSEDQEFKERTAQSQHKENLVAVESVNKISNKQDGYDF